MKKASVYTDTPTISVIDNRGLQTRTLEYNRIEVGVPVDEYITRNTYTTLGNLEGSMDPRLFSQYQDDRSTLSNTKYSNSLNGEVLCIESVDAGRKVSFLDIRTPISSINTRA